MTAFIEAMDKLAAEIATKATGDAVALADKIDAFKALVPYYVQQRKKPSEKDEFDGNDFGSFQARINESENGNGSAEPGVRNSRRNGN